MPHLTLPQLGRRIPIAAEQTILQAALEAGVPYPHGCRSGRCGSCKSRLISGDVELGKHSPFALTEEDQANGLILACRSAPTTDVTIEWLDEAYVAMTTVVQAATVVAVESKTHDILAIRLKLDDRSAFRFAAGQYLSLAMPGAPARHYSMASRPDDELVELHVRLVPGGRTSSVIHASVKADDRVEIEGPAGSAYLRDAHGGPIIAVAGGSGLAPIKSIVEAALGAGMSQPIHLYFGARTEDDLYLVDHFCALVQRFSNLIFVPVLSQAVETGRRTGSVSDALAEDHQQLAGAKAYVAGPPGMVDAVGSVLAARGVASSDIHADVFFTPEEDIQAVAQSPK
ncbi:2Fe-2S iron-sulfur cluster-binding protein [Bosea sp. 2KB_26]|uniref:2Fe-2S iron-sulfur cluster-binding protein n=1 Tax=Bosea sp. 2KB_26 TaxID=3237475 RepID=UPI003F8F6EB0